MKRICCHLLAFVICCMICIAVAGQLAVTNAAESNIIQAGVTLPDDVFEPVTKPVTVGKVSHWNVVMEGDLQVVFYMQISDNIKTSASISIVFDGVNDTYSVSELEKNQEGYYIVSTHVSAAQMNDNITVSVFSSNEMISSVTYSVRKYCDVVLADNQYSKFHPLIKEMLNYGGAAQVYFQHNVDNLASTGLSNVATKNVPNVAENTIVSGRVPGVSFYGASLLYQNRIAVRYYFKFNGDVSGVTFSIDDRTYTPQSKDGLYYIELPDILPQQLDREITLTVDDGNGHMLCVAYSPMDYIVRMYEKGHDSLKTLVKALYNYHLAAKEL